MRYRVNDQIFFQEPPVGPLVPWLNGFAEALGAQKFSHRTIQDGLRWVVHFSKWLEQQQIKVSGLSCEDVARYVQTRPLRSERRNMRAPLRRLVEYLRQVGVIEREELPRPPTPAERCVQDYVQYLREQRGLAEATIVYYSFHAGNFLRYLFGHGEVVLPKLNAADVLAFLRHATARVTSRRSKALVAGSLRAFLRYAHGREEGMPNLAIQVPKVASWPITSVPRAIAADQVQKLLKSVDRNTSVGRRDYAMLLLLSRLGLRAGEITSLTLDDVDWRAGTLTVTLKGGRRSVYPLTEEIGEAIADYLQTGRPESDDRQVFLQVKAPFRPFRRGCGLADIVRSRVERAGVDAPTRGTHQFRHGLATQMLRKGVSLSEIGDVLGHRQADTTRIYAKVDIGALRTLAQPWPGGVQ